MAQHLLPTRYQVHYQKHHHIRVGRWPDVNVTPVVAHSSNAAAAYPGFSPVAHTATLPFSGASSMSGDPRTASDTPPACSPPSRPVTGIPHPPPTSRSVGGISSSNPVMGIPPQPHTRGNIFGPAQEWQGETDRRRTFIADPSHHLSVDPPWTPEVPIPSDGTSFSARRPSRSGASHSPTTVDYKPPSVPPPGFGLERHTNFDVSTSPIQSSSAHPRRSMPTLLSVSLYIMLTTP